jgi:hypothetical protein
LVTDVAYPVVLVIEALIIVVRAALTIIAIEVIVPP